ncbi:MAG: lipopolysaccharide biosynthesis protein [Candidatus Marinimicrobia bacterium]|nr:lipopolysaccharide biosynthesis protein [Candidatus Neomarinimicrobiota bacterium]
MNNIGTLKKSIHGGKWMFFDTILQKAISLGSFLILARFLVPEDFGVIAIILIAPNIADILTSPGFESALIKNKKDPTTYMSILWTFNVLRSFAIFLVLFFGAPIFASFFNAESLIWAFRLSGIFIIIQSLSSGAKIFFLKNIDFKKIFIRDISASLSYAIVAISLAIIYKSYWALFGGYVAQYSISTIITYFLHEFRPRLDFKFKKLYELISYSKWIFGQNLVSRAIPQIENSLLGKLVGATGVGLYTKAKSLASMPSAPFYNIISKVTFPAYSRIQDSFEKIKDGFLKSINILFFITVPVSVLFIEAGHRIILILLGENWIGVDALLRILIVAVTINIFSNLAGPIFNATSRPRAQFRLGFINLITLVVFISILTPIYGTIGAATAFLISSVVTALISLYVIARILKIKIIEIITPLITPLVSSIIILILGKIVLAQTIHISHFGFIALITTLGAIYVTLVYFLGVLLKTGPYKTLLIITRELLQR